MNVIVYCGVSYDEDLDEVERIATEASAEVLQESEHAIKTEAPFFGFETFGESNVVFWVFVQATDRLGSFVLQHEIVKGLHARFRREGIVINYPVRKLVYSPMARTFHRARPGPPRRRREPGRRRGGPRPESEA